MKAMGIQGIGSALGVCEPWSIQSIGVDEHSKTINIHLEIKKNKSLFGFLGANKNPSSSSMVSGQWHHMPIGMFNTIIHAQIPESGFSKDEIISQALIAQASFLGHPQRRYSNFLRQQFALFQAQNFDTSTLSKLYQIDSKVTETLLKDLSSCSEHLKSAVYLPIDSDPVWKNILLDKKLLHTNILPLKLLLSKLKLASIKDSSESTLKSNTLELRKFIISNLRQATHEIDQLSGVDSKSLKQKALTVKSRQRLLLPSLKNTLWIDIINGKLALNSQSLPLNLLISKQRKSFLSANTNEEKINAVSQLRKYFHKNYRSLKPELLLINRMMSIKKNIGPQLPAREHEIWKKILENDDFLPSDHIAYKLLLARLRMQLSSKVNPVVQLDAAKSIRDFIDKNKKVMHKELDFLLAQSKVS